MTDELKQTGLSKQIIQTKRMEYMKKIINTLRYLLMVQLFISVAAHAVETPSLNSLPSTQSVGSSQWIHWTRTDPISYYVLKRNLNGGAWTTEGVYYNLTNGAKLSFSQPGTHCFKVIATYSGGWSGFSNQSCSYAGYKGTITGQGAVLLSTGQSYTFSSGSVSISDSDSNNHSVYSVGAGANYSVSGTRVTPVAGFGGTLSVPVKYKDNEGFITNTYYFSIGVIGTASDPTVSYGETLGSFTLNWNASRGAAKYRIDQYTYDGATSKWDGESYTTSTQFKFNDRMNVDGYRYSIYGCTTDTKCVPSAASIIVKDQRLKIEADFSSQSSFDEQWNKHSKACVDSASIENAKKGKTAGCYRANSMGYYTKDTVEVVGNSAFIKVNVMETVDPAVGLLTCSAEQLNLDSTISNTQDRHYILTSGYFISKNKYKFGNVHADLSYQRVFGTQSGMWIDSDWGGTSAERATIGQEIDVDEYVPRIDRWHQSHQFTVHSHDEQRYVKCNGLGSAYTCLTRGSDSTDDDKGEYYLDLAVQDEKDAFSHQHTFGVEWKNENSDITYTLFRDGQSKGTYRHTDLVDHSWETDPNKVSANAGIAIEPDAAYVKFSIEVGKDFHGILYEKDEKENFILDENGNKIVLMNDRMRLCSVIGSALNADGTIGTPAELDENGTEIAPAKRTVTLGGMKVNTVTIYPQSIVIP